MRTRFCPVGVFQTVFAALVLGVGAAWGDVAISRVADGYKVTVDAGTVPNRSYLTLAWDTTDAGEDFAAWTNTRVLASDLAAAGGTFTTPADDIPEGSFVRAFITQNVELLGGAVELADQVWIDTGCSESGTYGMDVGVRLTGRSCNWASVMGASLDKFTIGTNNGNLDLLYLRLNSTDTGARATLDNTQCNQMVIRDRDWIVNGTTVTHVNGTGAMQPGGTSTIHLGTTAARNRFTSGFWYWARFFGADGAPIAELYPARVLPQDQFGFFDTVKGKMVFPGTGSVSVAGDVTNTVANVLAVSAVAEAVDPLKVVAAYWTGAAGDGAVDNPANWTCRNAMDEVVVGGLPGLSAAVHLEGNLNLDFTAASVLTGRTFTVNGALTRDTVLVGSCVTAFEGMSTLAIPGGCYLDTGVYATQKTRVVMDITVQGTREYWFGAWNKGYKDGAFCLGNDGGGVYAGYGNQGGTQGSIVSIGRHVVELDRGEVKVDGTVTRTFEANEFQVNYPLYLCAQNRTGTLGYYADQVSTLVHACQIYEDGVLVRDYVPVARPFDGAVGFLERVSDAFVSFVGTGVTASGATHRDLVRPPAPLAFSAGLIDLDGYNLTLADADGSAEMVLRNTAENPARVTLDVPAEKSAKLSLQLVGAIDLVKTGAGTLEANRANDAYTGGLTVEAGTVVNGRAFAYQPIWGAAGAWITVKSGAVYENNGYSGYRYNFDLAGVGQGEGALVNRVDPSPMQGAFWLQNYAGDMRLSDDALITLYARWGFSADDDAVRHALTFNGHTLTVNAGNQLFLRGVNATDAGRLVCAGFGEAFDRRLSFYGIPSDFSKVTVEVLPSGRLSVEEPVTFGTYISQATNEANCVFKPVTVRDRYQPHLATPTRAVHLGTADNPKPVLDLSQLDEPYTFRYTEADPEGLLASFSVEPGVTVAIDLGTRAISSGQQIVDLTANEFAKLANVTFTLTPELRARGYRLARRATGLYLDAGFSILVR